MERLGWAIASPGSFEADLVHHCGQVAAGEYVHTLQLVDIATGWSERVAVFGRSQAAMVAGFQHVQTRLPFPISQLHPDNGSEFFNDHLIRYFGEEMTGLRLSRSRPYRKNDNRFVEQKNATLVRAYTGYDRLDSWGQCAALNALYDQTVGVLQPVPAGVAPGGQGSSRGETPTQVGPGTDTLPAAAGQRGPFTATGSKSSGTLCRDQPTAVTAGNLPSGRSTVATPQVRQCD